jgi:iron(III) transport system substrate-binding protein
MEPQVVAWAEDAFAEAHPGFGVRFVVLPADQVLSLLAGGSSPPGGGSAPPSPGARGDADLWWGAPSWTLARAAKLGLFADGGWEPVTVDPLVLAYGSDSVPRGRAPRDWADLLHVRWSGEILLPEPGASEAMTALLAHRMWVAWEEYGDEVQGLDWFQRVDAWRRAYVTSDEAVRRLRAGDGLLAILPLSVAEEARVAGGVDFRVPESPTPALVQGAGLLVGAPHPEAGRIFLEWLGSPAAGAGLAQVTARVPAGGLSASDAPSWAARVLPALVTAPVLPDSVAPRVDGWVALWRADARGRTPTIF